MPFDGRRQEKHSSPAAEVLVVGAGAAGLMTALSLVEADPCVQVTVIAPAPLGEACASAWSQGGLAAAVGKDDDTRRHAADTLKAAAGTADPEVVAALTAAAPALVEKLVACGLAFARDGAGGFALSREACHDTRRVLKAAAGDGFGRELMRALGAAVAAEARITVKTGVTAERLLRRDGGGMGPVVGIAARLQSGKGTALTADAVVLATGGLGGLYAATTNPLSATGRGLALAARAGAVLSDLEFVQFHPTALDIGEDPMPLATEALRGEGAVLRNGRGRRFMQDLHPMAELAPRDVVSRGIFAEMQAGEKVYLDCRFIDTGKFPALLAAAGRAGLNPQHDMIPVVPAVHYHMGGVATDLSGRTSLQGLWAVGEVAATGLHGANRLASNSLMEALVMAERAARDILARLPLLADARRGRCAAAIEPPPALPAPAAAWQALRQVMSDDVGVIRDAARLCAALQCLRNLGENAADPVFADAVLVATMVTASALARQESRGAHCRADYPRPQESLCRRSFVTWKDVSHRVAALKQVEKEMIYV